MMRLDHNRAKAQLAAKCDVPVSAVSNMTIWGNHSATQYPDLVHAQVNGKPAMELVDQAWVESHVHPDRAAARRADHRGARRVVGRVGRERGDRPRARLGGRHGRGRLGQHGCVLRRLLRGPRRTDRRDSPSRPTNGEWSIVDGLDLDEFSRARIDASVAELAEERDTVQELGLLG